MQSLRHGISPRRRQRMDFDRNYAMKTNFFNVAAKRTLKTLSLPFEVTSGGMQRNPWLPYEKSHQKCSTWCSMRILACRIVHIEDVAIYGWESPGDSSLWTALVSLSVVSLEFGFSLFCLSEAS